MSTHTKQVDDVCREAERQGWRTKILSSGHVQLMSPDSKTIVTTGRAGTSGSHSFENFMSSMRKGGYMEPDSREAMLAERDRRNTKARVRDWFLHNPERAMTPSELAPIMERDRSTVNQAMVVLLGDGYLEKIGDGHGIYSLAPLHRPLTRPEAETARGCLDAEEATRREMEADDALHQGDAGEPPIALPAVRLDAQDRLKRVLNTINMVVDSLAELEADVKMLMKDQEQLDKIRKVLMNGGAS